MRYRKIIGSAIGSSILLALLVLIGVHIFTPQSAAESEHTSTAAPVPPSTKELNAPPSDNPSADRPSADQVWALEEGNLIPDQSTRAARLEHVAMPQYIQTVPAVIVRPTAADVTFQVIRDSSSIDWQAGTAADTYYVIAHAVIQTKRDATVLNTYSAPSHATLWHKTADGWRVQQDVTVEMR